MKVKKQGWLHIGKYLPDGLYISDGPHLTKEFAERGKRKVPGKYIATIKIEWEEEV